MLWLKLSKNEKNESQNILFFGRNNFHTFSILEIWITQNIHMKWIQTYSHRLQFVCIFVHDIWNMETCLFAHILWKLIIVRRSLNHLNSVVQNTDVCVYIYFSPTKWYIINDGLLHVERYMWIMFPNKKIQHFRSYHQQLPIVYLLKSFKINLIDRRNEMKLLWNERNGEGKKHSQNHANFKSKTFRMYSQTFTIIELLEIFIYVRLMFVRCILCVCVCVSGQRGQN